MTEFDPMGRGGNPNLYDRTKYSAVLDQNNGIPPGAPVGYGGEFRQGMPQQYPGQMPRQYPGQYPGQMPQRNGFPPNGGPVQQPMSTQSISATLTEMEMLRKKINTRNILFAVGLGGLMVVMFMISMSRGNKSSAIYKMAPLIPIIFIGFGIVFFIAMKGSNGPGKRLKMLYKETFVRQLLNQHFQDVYYNWEQGMDQNLIKNSGICRLGNRYHSEDYLNAVYRGIRFQQADVTIQYHTSSGRSSHTTTYFQGRMFCFEYPSKRSYAVQVHSKNFIYAGEPASGIRREKLKMESVDFNKEFTVRALSGHDAFYILTPQMMERLRALRTKYGSITLVFDHGYVMVGLNSKMDSFDANLSKPIDYQTEMMRMRADVAVIEELIQLLNCIPA